jgi:cytochrome c-type biogenesis protein CcmH/NrfF
MRFKTLTAAALAAALAAATLGPARAFTLEEFTFDNPAQQTEFRTLIDELRCLVCQNESLSASQAELAQDLRREVYEMMKAGKTKAEVVDFLVARYGDFVLYSPPIRPSAGMRASRKKVWLKPYSPVSLRMGRVSTPGACIGARKNDSPAKRCDCGSVRASRIMYFA